MGRCLFAAAAAAWLVAAPMVRAADLCSFVKAAVADVPNNFASLKGKDPPTGEFAEIKPDVFPADASSCGVNVAIKRIGCFWVYPGVTGDQAKAKLDELSTRMGECLGPGYNRRAGHLGGVIFSDSEDRAVTAMFQSKTGAWETYVLIAGHGLALN